MKQKNVNLIVFIFILVIALFITIFNYHNRKKTSSKNSIVSIINKNKKNIKNKNISFKVQGTFNRGFIITDSDIERINKVEIDFSKGNWNSCEKLGSSFYKKNRIIIDSLIKNFENIYNIKPYKINENSTEKIVGSLVEKEFKKVSTLAHLIVFTGKSMEKQKRFDDALKLYFLSIRACSEFEYNYGKTIYYMIVDESIRIKRNILFLFVLKNLVSYSRSEINQKKVLELFQETMDWDISLEKIIKFQKKYSNESILINILSNSNLSSELQKKVKNEYVAEKKSKLLECARNYLNKKYDDILLLLTAQDDEVIGNLSGFFSKLNDDLEEATKNREKDFQTYFNLLVCKILIPDFKSKYKNIVKFSIERKIIFLSMIVRRFYEKYNFFPETFSQIGSNLGVFTDSLSLAGEDLKIKQGKDNIYIYSNGFNLYDDKGSMLLDIGVSIPKKIFDIK